jgi:hypothetical protein
MPRLDEADLAVAGSFLADANASESAEQLVEQIVHALPELLACDSAMYARFDTETCRTVTIATDPRLAELREQEPDAWWHCLDEHPIVPYRTATHDGRAVRFSDFVSRREFRRREIYDLFFGPCGAEYVMGVEFCRSAHDFIHVGCTRSARTSASATVRCSSSCARTWRSSSAASRSTRRRSPRCGASA